MRPLALSLALLAAPAAPAGVGDPQVRTSHPWYPGELACSTFERLFATQAEVFERVVGRRPESDHDKALASWLWRSTHYWHGEEGPEDLWGAGPGRGGDARNREYWTGLFSHGFGLCGTTHSQWVAEFDALFGRGRARGVGVAGHNSFEVFLTGGPYGAGRWAGLDHDLATLVFDADGKRLLSLNEIRADWRRLTDRAFLPMKQRGWPVCGLHAGDAPSFAEYNVAEYAAGYAGPPPKVHLRRGETLRRTLRPGLEDGKTFVFWGRNDNSGGVPGPARAETWVNRPDDVLKGVTRWKAGQARYANAVFTYAPDFATAGYREGIVAEDAGSVTLEFASPYVVAATPAAPGAWGVLQPGCRNGLVLRGRAACPVAVSVDRGKTWADCGPFRDGLDLTDHVKGRRHYWLRLGAPAKELVGLGVALVTVCQASAAVMPHLTDGGTDVRFEASHTAVASAGSAGAGAAALELTPPAGGKAVELFAAAHVASGNPPREGVKYQIEWSPDAGRTWRPVVRDWGVPRRGEEPADFWSQAIVSGSASLASAAGPVRVRFRNSGGRPVMRSEAHLTYRTPASESTRVTFAWDEDAGPRAASHTFGPNGGDWKLPTGTNVRTRWVEFACAP